MTDASKEPTPATPAAPRPTHEEVLRELYTIRKERQAKHVPYELERELKKRDRAAWAWAQELVDPQPKKVDPVDRAAAAKKKKAAAPR
jgi:hypothetical protein